nr:zinc finger protein 84 [Hymenolepis microstoma]
MPETNKPNEESGKTPESPPLDLSISSTNLSRKNIQKCLKSPIRNDNSYVGVNVHTEGTISEEFKEHYKQWKENILSTITRIWESKTSTRSSTKSANTIITKLIASKHGEPEPVFDAADRPVEKSPLHSVIETNAHSPAQFSSTAGLEATPQTHIERKQFRCDICESNFTHKASTDIYHSHSEYDIQPLEEKFKFNLLHYGYHSDETFEQFSSNCVTSCAAQQQNPYGQDDNSTEILPSVQQILPPRMNTDFNILYGSEGSYNGWIQSNEFSEEKSTLYRFDDYSSVNCAVNCFYYPICPYDSLERSQFQDHLHAIDEENTNSATCQASNRKCNSYIGGTIPMKGAISGGFIENITQRSNETTRSEKSNLPSTESENAYSASVISPKHGNPIRKHKKDWNSLITSSRLRKNHFVGRGINESTPTASNSSLFHNSPCTFESPEGSLNKSCLHTVNEVNGHSQTVCTTDIATGVRGDKEVSLKENPRVQQMDDTGENLRQYTKCGAQFSSTGRPRAHQRTQLEGKRISCDECGNTFSRKYNLKVHKRIHSGERQFGCGECDLRLPTSFISLFEPTTLGGFGSLDGVTV